MRRYLAIATLAVAALAQAPDYPPPPDSGDAPDHGVARLSLINGNVSVSRGDSGELASAAMNAPVVTGDRVLTGEGSRAEVQFDGANLARLAPSSEVRMGDLQYRRYQVQIARGLVTFRMLRDSDAQVEISTPSVSVRPLRQGTYRILVRPDGTSEITVRAGEAEVYSPRAAEPLRPGQTMLARGSAYDPEIQIVAGYPADDWDRWNADRDRFFERGDASRYVSPDIYGTEDLSGYGRWTNDPAYGQVWVPSVDADWAPYRDGRWDYIDYYGWSWISYDPWGWAPYHYGRWYRGAFGWAWYPGPIGPRYYWRPALVAFFGWGSPGFGVGYASFGFGNVGWVPLAPFEPYRPWYGRGFAGGRDIVVNNTNVVNVYRNARFTNAVTSVRAGDFGRTAVRGNNFVRPSGADLSRAGLMNGHMPFAPAARFPQFGGAPGNTQSAPRANPNGNARFFQAPSGAGAQPGPSNGGWRRMDQAPGGGAAPAPPQARPGLSPGFNQSPNFPQGRFTPAPREQQPVRISPPIVNNRNEGGFSGTRGNGFGGPRPNFGGGGGFSTPPPREPQGGNFSGPRAPQGGGGFSGPRGGGPPAGGGAPRGGGGGGGRSNGGGHGGGHR